jgi:hypothetical protein
VTTEVQVTAESSGSQTPPSTPEGSIAPVLHKSQASAAHNPWGSPPDHYGLDNAVSPTGGAAHNMNKPFTTISSVSTRPREAKKKRSILKTLARTWRKFINKLGNLDPIKLAYLRTSFVFAISILVTWTPSSINRVYSLIHPTRTSYGLNLAGAIVLPLQGLWNAIIFAATSWNILKDEFGELRRGRWVGFRGHRRVSDDRGKLPAAASRHGTIPLEDRELPPLSPISRISNVRVIRGGSL